MNKIQHWVEKLKLQPHPEGGYFRETYRSDVMEGFHGFRGIRNVCTGIYFLLTEGNFSAFHRIKSDEMWHFYDGDPIAIHIIDEHGTLEIKKLGLDLDKGEEPQLMVKAGCWFASKVANKGQYALVGCTVSPGFDFEDFELADRIELIDEFPQHEHIIRSLTR